jgi:copper chaperone CopZ
MDRTNTQSIERPALSFFETNEIAIEGMTCDKCVEKIEHALGDKEGVREVVVDRQRGIATVTFDTRKTDIPELHDILLRAGYKPTTTAS